MTVSRIAFIGLGKMGRGIAANLIAAGHQLTVFNRSAGKAAALEQKGAVVAATPAEAVRDAEIVMTIVTDDRASEAVWLAPDGVLSGQPAAGALAIESSTVSRRWLLTLAERTKARGLRFLDCPVAGRPDAAAAGQLSVFVGGADPDVAAAKPVLACIGKSITHFGPIGSAISFKLIYNMLGAVQIAAVAEAMAACVAADIDLNAAAEVFASGGTGSPHVRRHAHAMATGVYDRPVHFTPVGRVKDLQYGIELAGDLAREAVLAAAARLLYQRMIDGGQADLNDSELFEFLKPR